MVKHRGMDGLDATMLELEFYRDTVNFKGTTIVSAPPAGCHKVVNLYIDVNGKLVVDWSDIPEA